MFHLDNSYLTEILTGFRNTRKEVDIHVSVHHNTIFIKLTNKMQLCRIIYFSLPALHVSSDVFAHHQEHLNCN